MEAFDNTFHLWRPGYDNDDNDVNTEKAPPFISILPLVINHDLAPAAAVLLPPLLHW